MHLKTQKKQKKRVYREGVGWTYESNEAAISSAKENLDNLDIQRQQESLQYQIDQTNLLKDILEGLDEEKQKKANLDALKQWGEKLPDDAASLVSKLSEGGEVIATINTSKGEITKNGEVIGRIENDTENAKSDTAAIKNSVISIDSKIALVKEMQDEAEKKLKSVSDKYFGGSGTYKEGFSSTYSKGTLGYTQDADNFNAARDEVQTAVNKARAAGITDSNKALVDAEKWLKNNPKQERADFVVIDSLSNPKNFDSDQKEVHNFTASKVKLEASTNTLVNDTDREEQFEYNKNKYLAIKEYKGNNEWGDWVKKGDVDLSGLGDYTIVMNADGRDCYAFSKGGRLYWLIDSQGNIKNKDAIDYGGDRTTQWATGTLSTPTNSPSLINELGTEAIITPSGTVTALPAKTGIVPADVTKNLWSLGEVAPTLVAQLGSLNQKTISGTPANTTYEEGQYFDNFTMNVYPTKDYDMDKLLMEARAKFNLTKHNN